MRGPENPVLPEQSTASWHSRLATAIDTFFTGSGSNKVADPSRRRFLGIAVATSSALLIAPALVIDAITANTAHSEGQKGPKPTSTPSPEATPSVETETPLTAERIVQGIKEEAWQVWAIELPNKTYTISSLEVESILTGQPEEILAVQEIGFHEPSEFIPYMPTDLLPHWERLTEATADLPRSYVFLIVKGPLTEQEVLFLGFGSGNPSVQGLTELLDPIYNKMGVPEEGLVEGLQYYLDTLDDDRYNGIPADSSVEPGQEDEK